MRHRDSGVMKNGYFGFSWTTLFFGPFPALLRADFITFVGWFVIYPIIVVPTFFLTLGVTAIFPGFVWAFFYNGYYTRRLLERGYIFVDDKKVVREACRRLGVVPRTVEGQRQPDISNASTG